MTREQSPPPPHIWRGLGLAAVLLLLLSVATIAAISAGIMDPGPAGPPLARHTLGSRQTKAGEERHMWIAGVPTGAYTVRLTAAHAGGEPDSAYGLILGNDDGYFVAALSPLGYAAVWEQQGAIREMHLPWQPWPHVETGSTSNEIQVDVTGDAVTVRINRELLWQGRASLPDPAAGIFLQSFGRATTVDFQTISFYQRSATR